MPDSTSNNEAENMPVKTTKDRVLVWGRHASENDQTLTKIMQIYDVDFLNLLRISQSIVYDKKCLVVRFHLLFTEFENMFFLKRYDEYSEVWFLTILYLWLQLASII